MGDGRHLSTTAADALHAESAQAIAPLLNFIDPHDDASFDSSGSVLLASLAAGKWPTLESVIGGSGNNLSLLAYRVPLPPTPVPELGPFLKRHAAAIGAYASRREAELAAAAAAAESEEAEAGPRLGMRRRSSSRAAAVTTATADGAEGSSSSNGAVINVPEPGEGLLRAEREIPAVFFREEFDLSSQEAWVALLGIAAAARKPEPSEEASAAASPSPKSVLASAADLDLRELAAEKAARLACLADGALVDEVAARAPIFGAAAATLGGLRGDVASVAAQAREGETSLRAAASRAAASADSAKALVLRRKNLRAALAALEPLETARDAREALSAALPLGDFTGALLALEALRGASAAFGVPEDRGDIGAPSPPPPVPLAVAALSEDIRAAEAGVRRLLKGAAARALHLGGSPSSSSSSDSAPPPPDASALRAIISGAVRGRCLQEVMEAVGAAGAAEAKAAVASAAAAALGGNVATESIEDRLSSLADASNFELALVAAARGHAAALRHALGCREMLREVGVEGSTGSSSSSSASVVAAGADTLVRSVAAAGSSRWASLLSARSPASASSAKLPEVLRLLEAAAALERETAGALKALSSSLPAAAGPASSSSSSSFASSVRSPSDAASALSRAFVDSFHARARSWLVVELDADGWLPSAVPEGVQRAVARLEATAGDSPSSAPVPDPSLSSSPADVLVVRGVPHPTAAAGLALAAALCEYASTAAALPSSPSVAASSSPASSSSPSHAAALALRAAELAKVFNGRACQLVLGAGALTASRGRVRALTARRLAVASRTLGAAAAVVEVARDAFFAIGGGGGVGGGIGSSDISSSSSYSPRRRRAGDASAAGAVALACAELDSAVADLQTHREELHSKLASLVGERCSAGLAEIAADPEGWIASGSLSSSATEDAASAADGGEDGGAPAPVAATPAPPSPSSSSTPFPSPFARDMSKHLSSLESALTPLLSAEETASVLGRATAALSSSCAEALSAAAHRGGAAGRAQAAADGMLLLESLRALKLPEDVAERALAPLEAVFAPPKRRKQQQQQREVVAAEEEKKAREAAAAAASAVAAAEAAEGVPPIVSVDAEEDSGITAAAEEQEAATQAGAEASPSEKPDVDVVEAAPPATRTQEPEGAEHPLSPPPPTTTTTLLAPAPPSPPPIQENGPNE